MTQRNHPHRPVWFDTYMNKTFAAVAAVGAALLLSACSSSDSETETQPQPEQTADEKFLAALDGVGIKTQGEEEFLISLGTTLCEATDPGSGTKLVASVIEGNGNWAYPGKGEAFAKAALTAYCPEDLSSASASSTTTKKKNVATLGLPLTVTTQSSGDEALLTFNSVVPVDVSQCSDVNSYNDPGTLYAIEMTIEAGGEEFRAPNKNTLSVTDAQGYSKKLGLALATCSEHPEIVDRVAADTKARGWIFVASPVEKPAALIYQDGGASMTIELPA